MKAERGQIVTTKVSRGGEGGGKGEREGMGDEGEGVRERR